MVVQSGLFKRPAGRVLTMRRARDTVGRNEE